MTEDAACFNSLPSASELSPSFLAGDEDGPEAKQQLGRPSVCTGEACVVGKCCTVSDFGFNSCLKALGFHFLNIITHLLHEHCKCFLS